MVKNQEKYSFIVDKQERLDYIKLIKENSKLGMTLKEKSKLSLIHYKKYPNSIIAAAKFAALFGDYGQMLGPTVEKKNKKISIEILRPLSKKLRNVHPFVSRYVRNELYYHSSQFKKQYLLGIQIAKEEEKKYDFSAAVGASEYAFLLISKGQVKRAKDYADISVLHWESLYKKRDLNSNCFYLQALAIKGDPLLALKKVEYLKTQGIKAVDYKRWYDKYSNRIRFIMDLIFNE